MGITLVRRIKMFKKVIEFTICITLLIVLVAARRPSDKPTQAPVETVEETQPTGESTAEQPKIGIAFSAGSVGSSSFKDMQYNGLIEASRQLDIAIVYEVAKSREEEDRMAVFSHLVEVEDCQLIFASGHSLKEPFKSTVSQYLDVHFVFLDEVPVLAANVSAVTFGQHEGSFVVGALATQVSQTRKIGFIGGVNIDIIEAFRRGFQEGIEYIDPSVQLITEYITLLPDATGFARPEQGYELAKQMYSEGIDIIYAVAGGSGNGIIQAAKDNEKFVIGVDANQDHLAKGFVLTSMMKRLDVAVVDISRLFVEGKLEGNKVYEYGYKDGGVSLTEMEFSKDKIPPEVLANIKEIEQKIASGEIVVIKTMIDGK